MIDKYSSENASASERMVNMTPRARENERTVSSDTNSLNRIYIEMMTDISIDRVTMNVDERHDITACTQYGLHSRLELIEHISLTDG